MFKNNKEVFIILVSLLKTVTNSLHVVSARIKSNSYKRRNEKLDRSSELHYDAERNRARVAVTTLALLKGRPAND